MKNIKILSLALMLVFYSPVTLKAQNEPSLAVQIRQALAGKEPSWRYVAVIQSGRVPIVPSERRVLASHWERKSRGRSREGVGVYVYEVGNSTEARKWLGPFSNGQVARDWRVSKYSIGDEGYVVEFQNGKQFEIKFRKGEVVVEVSGRNLGVVERFARRVVAQLPAS